MTDDTRRYLAEVKERCEKAQAGPWSVASESAEFIANVRQDIPRLLTLIETLHSAILAHERHEITTSRLYEIARGEGEPWP